MDGVLSVVPYYNKPSQEGLLEHFGQIAKCTNLPIILYNIPGRTGINMEPRTVSELAKKYKNIVGYKDATGNLENTSQVIQLTQKGFLVYIGLLEAKLKDAQLTEKTTLVKGRPRQTFKLGALAFTYARNTHSIADSFCLIIHTPAGKIVHSGDFKFDFTTGRFSTG